MGETVKTYFIASAKCREVKAFDGSVLTEDDSEVWLGMDEGYAQCFAGKSSAHKFKEPPTNKEAASWDGMPWYCRLKPGSLRVFKVVDRSVCATTETEVTDD